ncbi:MAG: IS1634 family transposase [Chloroflexi bacterium]|nr:IS1634 family transposase [Chloroflexota bacterium]
MYLRTTRRRNRDGSEARYLSLAHNVWDPKAGRSTVKILYNFGREDALDRAAIRRLIGSLSRALEPGEALALQAPGLRFCESRPYGGSYLLDQLWRRLGVREILERLLRGRRLEAAAERVLFALVANRALEPLSKLSCAAWVSEHVAIPGLDTLDDDRCYRAMDWLLAVEPELAEQVYWSVANLLNLEIDLLFFDTTSTYFETEEPDPPDGGRPPSSPGAPKGFRTYGHSKDHRPDLPQVVIGLAVTREGIPIRVWTFPGNASDQELIRHVKDDLRAWKLGRVVWVADRGFSSAENRRSLQRAGGHYIIGEKLRSEQAEAQAALALPGRYHTVAGNLEVKEVVLDEGTMRDRFVVCRNPVEASRDAAVRDRLLEQLEVATCGSDERSPEARAELACRLREKPVYRRFLRVTRAGLLRIDRGAVVAEARLDGKFLLRTSDPTLSAEDVALGYKQLLEVERAWRDMKTTLDLRPVYHRKEARIRAHVLLCWLALLLIRIAENATGETWRTLRWELEKLHLGRFFGPAGEVSQRTETTSRQAAIFKALGVAEPPRFFGLVPAEAAATA